MALILVILGDDERPEQQRSQNTPDADRREVHRADNLAFKNRAEIEPGIAYRAFGARGRRFGPKRSGPKALSFNSVKAA